MPRRSQYREAAFYRLESLQRAIEESHLDLVRTTMVIDSEGKLKETQIGDWNKFWKNKKNWWESQAKKTTTKKIKQPEWWMEYSEAIIGPCWLSCLSQSH